jgi:hypothetical protein
MHLIARGIMLTVVEGKLFKISIDTQKELLEKMIPGYNGDLFQKAVEEREACLVR